MMPGFGKSVTQTLEGLLERQRIALLNGDLPSLAGLADRLEKGFSSLRASHFQSSEIAHLKELASRNAKLIKAAMLGLEQVRGSVMAPRMQPLSTYDASGRMQTSSGVRGRTLVRR